MIRRLVGFPTVSRDSNLELIAFVRDYLTPLGAEVRLTHDDDGRKANLFATFAARSGETRRGGVVLSGHTDVVPVDGQNWTVDPFALVERDGRLYGRGASDMKGFLAIALALVPELVGRGLERPLHLALSYDEEVGCLGVGRMIEDLVQAGIRPESCIVGEPTLMKPVIAHKGKKSYRCTVHGFACHSAYAPQGVNALEYAAEAVAFLKAMARRKRTEGPFDHGFDVPHSTVHTGVFQGGTALNIVPHEAGFVFEFRHLPGDDPDAMLAEFRQHVEERLLPEMRGVWADSRIEIETLSVLPALDTGPERAVVGLAQELSGIDDFGKVSFGTEASQFQAGGIPTVVCGPGSIAQAHKADEFVAVDQVVACERFLRGLAERICSPRG
jgi:acetylornithine deacetylase